MIPFRSPVALFLVVALQATAEQSRLSAVPSTLLPWVPWVMRDAGDEVCPTSGDEKRCLALSSLDVSVRGSEATFVLTGMRWSEGAVPLPGDSALWPDEVRGNAGALPVVSEDEQPRVRLGAGPFRITGRVRWTRRPASIPISLHAALETFSVNGKRVELDDGQIWLHRESAEDESAVVDTLGMVDLKVYRTVHDGVPVRLETRIALSVSGRDRRLDLAGILPAGSLPVDVSSDLPARLTREGRLSLTAKPGQWEVTIGSVWIVPPKRFEATKAADPWPTQEVWSFEAAPGIRSVQLNGGSQVDAHQAGVAENDAALPAWSVAAGSALEVKEILRGDPVTDSVKMDLQRAVWVDFEGHGATVVDDLKGQILRPIRLSVLAPLHLGRGIDFGKGMVLTSVSPGEQGFPATSGAREIKLVSRWEQGLWYSLPASPTGWEFSSGRMEVKLGPGWRLLDLLGPGSSEGTWVSRWNLWSIFLVVLAAALLGRLGGLGIGVGAAVLFVAGRQDGVGTGWWVHLAVAALCWQLVSVKFSGSRFEVLVRVWAVVAAIFVGIKLVPFTIAQARLAVHPSLAHDEAAGYGETSGRFSQQSPQVDSTALPVGAPQSSNVNEGGSTEARSMPSASMQNSVMDKMDTKSDGLLGEDVDPNEANMIDVILAGGGGKLQKARGNNQTTAKPAKPTRLSGKLAHFSELQMATSSPPKQRIAPEDPFLIGGVQSGPGEPDWSYNSGVLNWDGPVAPSQSVRILALSPLWVRLWRILEVLGAWFLGWMLLRRLAPGVASKLRLPARQKLSVVPLVLLASVAAHADFPSSEMLDHLHNQLIKPAACEPNCARLGSAKITVHGDLAVIDLEVHAADRGEVMLPEISWIPTGLSVPHGAAGAQDDGGIWAVVEPGIQTIRMEGRVKDNDLLVSFASVPFRRQVDAPGWRREGEDPSTVHLVRDAMAKPEKESESADTTSAELAPLARIVRTLHLQREWTMETVVRRASSYAGAIALNVPLLKGETVLSNFVTDSLRVKAVLPSGVDEIAWTSRLPVSSSILLKAESTQLWTETWIVESASRWQVSPSGLPRIQAELPTWMPVSGESLTLAVAVPKPLAGSLMTIENARMDVTTGSDLAQVDLVAQVRAEIGGDLLIRLPAGANVRTVTVNGLDRNPLKTADGRTRVEISPNRYATQRVEVTWHQEGTGTFFLRSPEVVLSAAGVNAKVSINQIKSGWIVAMGGPGDGPAVLWWGVIAAMTILAFCLSRMPGQPLGFWSWFLLFFGTSTVSHLTVIPFALWVGVLIARSRLRPETIDRRGFAFMQVGIAALTLISWGWLLSTIPQGLLGRPDMMITGHGGETTWFVDRFAGVLPRPWEIVLPLWLWRALLLAWSLWLAFSSMKWAVWGWNAASQGGIWPESNAEVMKAPTHPVEDVESEASESSVHDETGEEK